MLVAEGDIPLSLKRKSPVVNLIEERSPDQSSNDRKSFWRFVPDHVHHLHPRAFCFLRPCVGRPALHPRCRRRQRRGLWSVLGADPHHRQHRHRRRAVPDPQAAERNPHPRLRHGSCHGMRLHRRGHHQPPYDRDLAPGGYGGRKVTIVRRLMMYTSALVPRGMAVLGLIGGSLIIASGLGVLFGVIEAGGVVQGLATIPEALWELLLGIWPIVRGFNPSAIARLEHESQ